MNTTKTLLSVIAVAGISCAHAFSFNLTPVTTATPNQAAPILINGTVTVASGETYVGWTQFDAPFLSNYSAGFNGAPQNFTTAFLNWNGVGSYSGAIYQHNINPTNLGYSGGMPIGFYGSNFLGPGGLSSIKLDYIDLNGVQQTAFSNYAIDVVPEPTTMILLTLPLAAALKKRRA